MSYCFSRLRLSTPGSQRGQAILFVVLLLAVGIGLFAYGAASSISLSQEQDVKTRLAMTMARDALIGWSVARTSPIDGANARPGELPCPDINPLDGYEDGSCAAGAIGRVPWKTLGIPEPKDETGETLWYAISGPFRIWNMNNTVINSDTKGNITVYSGNTSTVVTTEAVAIIFSPGVPLGQDRNPSTTALCPTTGTTIARNLCAANYLDSIGGINNATPNTNTSPPSFISAQRSASFNDRLLVVTTSELMPVVESRVARELRATLNQYYARTGVFTSANRYSDNTYRCHPTTYDGRIPLAISAGCAVPPADFADWAADELPTWFAPNNWNLVVHYAVSSWCASKNASDISQCSSAGGLTVTGVTTKGRALIIAAGRGLGAQVRPCPSASGCLEDVENANGDTLFVSPVRSALNNDRLLLVAEAP